MNVYIMSQAGSFMEAEGLKMSKRIERPQQSVSSERLCMQGGVSSKHAKSRIAKYHEDPRGIL